MICYNLGNHHYINMTSDVSLEVNDKDLILFNNIISNNGFTYSNGQFKANFTDDYIIVYHLNIDGTETKTTITTAILKNGGIVQNAIGNETQGQFSSSTAIHLDKGDTISIANDNGETFNLVFANITIYS